MQQDLGIGLSASMGMIGVLEIKLIVPTLCAHRYTQVRKPPPTVRCLLRDSATSKTWWCLPQSVVAA